MAIDRDDASTTLQDIEGVQRRTREQLTYASISSILIAWGVLVAGAYIYNHFQVQRAWQVWLAVILTGVGITIWSRVRYRKASGAPADNRVSYSMIALIVFGLIWSVLLGRMPDRAMGTFWPTLFMFGYVVMGLWLGRFFTYCGVAVTGLALAGYFWLGAWFHLWMAAVMAGAFIGSGLWLRRLRTPA